MKKTLLFLFLLLCITLSVSAQKRYSVVECRWGPIYNPWAAPDYNNTLPVLNKATVVHFTKSDTSAFITSCDIDTAAKKIYYYHCYGGLFGCVFIAKPDLDVVLANHFSPFDYYDVVASDYATVIDNAKKKLQADGTNTKFTAEEINYLKINDSVKFPSTLSKLLELDRQLVSIEGEVTRFHSVNPKNIVSTAGYGGSSYCPYGQMVLWRSTDTIVTFYNNLEEMPVFKALMDINKGVIYYYCRNDNFYDLSNHYDYNGNVVDELQISKEKVNLILKEKFDVFALYRIWLEWQRQIVTDAMQQTEHRASVAALKKYAVNDWIVQSKTLAAIESKINYCTHADQQYVLQHLRKDFAYSIADAKAWETGRMIYYTSGDKQYELRDHRGNVMVVISDAKKGIPRKDNPALVDHYEAIVLSAKDYSSFGAPLEGRSFNSGNYPYGFNGKRDDTETGYQDYGMRIYDPQIARFLSVDPLKDKYAELTPYQFASNSPISGIDRDGLEYLTAIYNVTIKNGQNTVTAGYVWYNAQAHNAHGSLGQGVNYQIKINNLDNRTATTNNYFVSRGGNNFISAITQYGNYLGSDPLPNFIAASGKPVEKTYRYDIDAVDFVDQQAKNHDLGYDRLNAAGPSSLFSDLGTTPYDEAAANSWSNFYSNNKEGSIDPFNGQVVNTQERKAAWRGKTLFTSVVQMKKNSISSFMEQNYSGEAKRTMNTPRSVNEKNREFNYQLFLQKYMQKDDKDNWIRRDEMWEGDKDKGFTPKKPIN